MAVGYCPDFYSGIFLTISTLMKTTNLQTVTTAAGYAAVVSVFVSGGAGLDM